MASSPKASSVAASAVMRGNRSANTRPEMRVRREVHHRGLRYRVSRRLEAGAIAVRPDLVFAGPRVAIFVDGCFWHRCPTHGTSPRSNAEYWLRKLDRNEERDRQVTTALEATGWHVLRFWEHEDPVSVADAVEAAVRGLP